MTQQEDAPSPNLIAYRTGRELVMPIVRASAKREWIDATNQRFAAQCLPLMMANQAGWHLLNPIAFRAVWNGNPTPDAVAIDYFGADGTKPASSHFGHGIVTFHIPYLFRTPPGWNLLARGPANLPKPGVQALEGLIETDWAVATFTMNWQITIANFPVEFAANEPICLIVPQRRGDLEQFTPDLANLSDEPATKSAFQAWSKSRREFNEELKVPGSPAVEARQQRHYIRGAAPDGTRATEHQTRLKLREFFDRHGFSPFPDASDEDEEQPPDEP